MKIMLKEFREHLGYNQKEFAKMIDKSQNTISRWEENPETLSMSQISEIARAFMVNEADLISFSSNQQAKSPWSINESFHDGIIELDNLINEVEQSVLKSENDLSNQGLTEQQIPSNFLDDKKQFLTTLKELSSRPKVSFIGESDSGKSTLINTLLGRQLLPTNYTPETSIGIKIAHINQKPQSQGFNSTAVFKHSSNEDKIDTEKVHDALYYENHLVERGSEQLLIDYGSYNGKYFDSVREDEANTYTIITYIDAPILVACELWDVPGGGTSSSEDLTDDLISKIASQGADIVIFLSTATQFLHTYDMVTLKDALESLPLLESNYKTISPLSNLFIVASQSGRIAQNNASTIQEIIKKRIEAFYKTLPPKFWENFKTTRQYDVASISSINLLERSFIFERDNLDLQNEFKSDIIKLLEILSLERSKRSLEYYNSQSNITKNNSFNHSLSQVISTLNYETKTIKGTIEEYKTLILSKTNFLNKNVQLLETMKNLANEYKSKSRDDIIKMYKKLLTEESVYNLLITNNVDRDRTSKEEFITSLQNYLVEEANKIIETHHQEFMNQFAKELQELVDKDPSFSVEVSKTQEPIFTSDNLNILFGSLASAGTAELFNRYFASFGNLGGYIPVTKAVSFFKNIGISVPGGTRGATQFIKKIGGPEIVATTFAVAVGASVYALTGRDWRKSFSKQIIKSFTKIRNIRALENPHSFGGLLQTQANIFWENIEESLSTEEINNEILQKKAELEQLIEVDAKTIDTTRIFLESLYLKNNK